MARGRGKGFPEILESPYFNLTREQLLRILLDIANEAREVKEFNRKNRNNPKTGYRFQELDKRKEDILGPGHWKNSIEMAQLKEFLAIQGITCSVLGTHTQKCKDCKRLAKLGDNPSDLIEFIRNIHEHKVGKELLYPGGALETVLFPEGYQKKDNFIAYWMAYFPKLFEAIAALESDPDQFVEEVSDACDMEIRKGLGSHKLIRTYIAMNYYEQIFREATKRSGCEEDYDGNEEDDEDLTRHSEIGLNCNRALEIQDKDRSDLIEFIGNVHEHVREQMHGTSTLETLDPTGSLNKDSIFAYWSSKIPLVWKYVEDLVTKSFPDQAVGAMLNVENLESNRDAIWVNLNSPSILVHLKVDWDVYVNNAGTVLTTNEKLCVKRKSSSPLYYTITKPQYLTRSVVVGLPELLQNPQTLSSHMVILITDHFQTNVSDHLENLGLVSLSRFLSRSDGTTDLFNVISIMMKKKSLYIFRECNCT